jgi:DNA-binding MarR family transcriptional regulator
MSSVSPSRRRTANAIKESLRALSTQLSLLNHQVGAQLELKDADFDCLDLIHRYGPLSPSTLARRAGLHPATMTGILDRLERGGWIARERDPSDRRAVVIRALRERGGEIYRLFSGMTGRMDALLAEYDEAELALLSGFLDRVTDAGRVATDDLTTERTA